MVCTLYSSLKTEKVEHTAHTLVYAHYIISNTFWVLVEKETNIWQFAHDYSSWMPASVRNDNSIIFIQIIIIIISMSLLNVIEGLSIIYRSPIYIWDQFDHNLSNYN